MGWDQSTWETNPTHLSLCITLACFFKKKKKKDFSSWVAVSFLNVDVAGFMVKWSM